MSYLPPPFLKILSEKPNVILTFSELKIKVCGIFDVWKTHILLSEKTGMLS